MASLFTISVNFFNSESVLRNDHLQTPQGDAKKHKGSREGAFIFYHNQAWKEGRGMSDNPETRRPRDDSKINIEVRDEVRWWCSQLSCNEMRLKNAVKAVGQSSEAVRKYLHR